MPFDIKKKAKSLVEFLMNVLHDMRDENLNVNKKKQAIENFLGLLRSHLDALQAEEETIKGKNANFVQETMSGLITRLDKYMPKMYEDDKGIQLARVADAFNAFLAGYPNCSKHRQYLEAVYDLAVKKSKKAGNDEF